MTINNKRAPYLSAAALLGASAAASVSFPVQAADPDFDIRGRLHMDYHQAAEDERDIPSGWYNRRARMGMDGSIAEGWDGRIEVDFYEGGTSAADFRLRRDLGPGRLWLGQYKVPQGLNQLTSSNDIPLIERSSVSNIIPDSRRIGLAYEQMGAETGFKAMTFGRALGDRGEFDGDQPLGLALRAVYAPYLSAARHEAAPRLHLGASVVREDYDEPYDLGLSDRPELRDGDRGGVRLLDTGDQLGPVEDTTKLGLEAAYISGPFSAEAEYLVMETSTEDGSDPGFDGFHVQGAYTLTGESRTYSTGGFGGVTPSSRGGAWEVVGRYSNMDLNDSGVRGGEQDNVTLGVNYYPTSTLRFMGNVVFVDFEDHATELDESPTLVGLRAQYSW